MPPAVIANFRRFVATTLDKQGEIHAPTRTTNSEGDWGEAWEPVATGIRFSVSSGLGGQSNYQQAILDRIGTSTAYSLTFEAEAVLGFEIDEDMRVYETYPESRTFRIVSIPNKGASNQADTTVLAIEST